MMNNKIKDISFFAILAVCVAIGFATRSNGADTNPVVKEEVVVQADEDSRIGKMEEDLENALKKLQEIENENFALLQSERFKEEIEKQLDEAISKIDAQQTDRMNKALVQVTQQVTSYFENHIKSGIIYPELGAVLDELQVSNETFRADLEKEVRSAFFTAIGDLSQSVTNEINAAKELEAEKKIQYELKISVDEIRNGVVQSCSATVYDILDAYTRRNRESMRQMADSMKQSGQVNRRLAELEAKVKLLSDEKASKKPYRKSDGEK